MKKKYHIEFMPLKGAVNGDYFLAKSKHGAICMFRKKYGHGPQIAFIRRVAHSPERKSE